MAGIYVSGKPALYTDVMGKGDPLLSEQKETFFRSALKRRPELGKPLEAVVAGVHSALEDVKPKRDGFLPAKAQQQAVRVALRGEKQLRQSFASTVVDASTTAMRQMLLAQNDALKRLGVQTVSPAVREKIVQSQATGMLTERFPAGSRVTLEDRINAHANTVLRKVEREVGRPVSGPGGVDSIRRNVELGLAGKGLGRTPVEGGSELKQMHRLMVAEGSRKSTDATLELYKGAGIELARWTLHPAHKWYGGKEICEKMAQEVPAATMDMLHAYGVDTSKMDLHGVYPVSRWPEYPHPWCKCTPMPFMSPAMRAKMLDSMVTVQHAGSFPTELISGTSVKGAEAKALSGAFNAVATELGLKPVVDLEMSGALGSRGLVQVFAAQIKGAGRTAQAQAALQQVMLRDLPAAEARLLEYRTRLEAEIAGMGRDVVMSKASQGFAKARKMAELQREMMQFDANVRAVTLLEEALGTKAGSFVTTATTTKNAALGQMISLGLAPGDAALMQKGRYYWLEVTPSGAKKVLPRSEQARSKELAVIKEGKIVHAPKGVVEATARGKFKLDPGQAAGMEFIAKEKEVLLHFAAGLGKTPMVIASVSDLAAAGKVKKALVAPPAPVRVQFAREIVNFNATGRVSLYLPEGDIASVKKKLLSGLREDLIDKDKLAEMSKEARAKHLQWVDEEAARRYARIDVLPVSKDPRVMQAQMAKDKNLFTVMGHDDLARNAGHVNQRFDYVAVDEAHQLTSPSTTGGSAKANALKQVTGGTIKYKVAMTGTATRNSLGELWDLADWLKPGRLPSKQSFLDRYDAVTLQSNLFEKSAVKMLRREIDPFVFTQESPVKARLINPFNERMVPARDKRGKVIKGKFVPEVSEAERTATFRDIEMTPVQAGRTKYIENQYAGYKRQYDEMVGGWREEGIKKLKLGKLSEAELAQKKNQEQLGSYVKKKFEAMEAALDADKVKLAARMEKAGIVDLDSREAKARIAAMPAKQRESFRTLRDGIEKQHRVLHPESWRDNEHFLNLHDVDGKAAKVQETLRLFRETIPPEAKTIIHAERAVSIDILEAELAKTGKKVLRYTGDMSMGAREEVLKAFNAGEADVLILSRAGSTGLNVQKVSATTIHFDTPLTYTEYLQREARNWRNGQKNDVTSYMLHNGDSALDRRRLEIFKEKRQVLAAVDEVTKSTAAGSPLALLEQMGKAGVKSLSNLRAKKVRVDALSTMQRWCQEFRAMGTFLSSCDGGVVELQASRSAARKLAIAEEEAPPQKLVPVKAREKKVPEKKKPPEKKARGKK